jgi:hypothetical protein
MEFERERFESSLLIVPRQGRSQPTGAQSPTLSYMLAGAALGLANMCHLSHYHNQL